MKFSGNIFKQCASQLRPGHSMSIYEVRSYPCSTEANSWHTLFQDLDIHIQLDLGAYYAIIKQQRILVDPMFMIVSISRLFLTPVTPDVVAPTAVIL